MEITVTLNHGVLDAEFTGENREEIETELVKFKKFLDDNDELFGGLFDNIQEETTEQTRFDSVPDTDSGPEADNDIQESLSPVNRATGISANELARFLYVDPDGEKDPEILIDDPDETFGTTKTGKQKPASLILLYLWRTCYDDKEEVNSSDLKDALAGSGIDPTNLFNVYDKHFNQKGPSNNILELSRSGQIQAQKEITNLVKGSA